MRRLVLQNAAHVITQCAHYYKMQRSLLQNASLLQDAAEQGKVVNNEWDNYEYSRTNELVLSSKKRSRKDKQKKLKLYVSLYQLLLSSSGVVAIVVVVQVLQCRRC